MSTMDYPRIVRKKEPVYTAVQFAGSSTSKSQIEKWMSDGEFVPQRIETRDLTSMSVSTPGGIVTAVKGDWIVRRPDGEFDRVSHDEFNEIFEDVT